MKFGKKEKLSLLVALSLTYTLLVALNISLCTSVGNPLNVTDLWYGMMFLMSYGLGMAVELASFIMIVVVVAIVWGFYLLIRKCFWR